MVPEHRPRRAFDPHQDQVEQSSRWCAGACQRWSWPTFRRHADGDGGDSLRQSLLYYADLHWCGDDPPVQRQTVLVTSRNDQGEPSP
jgi:hypothetical protein